MLNKFNYFLFLFIILFNLIALSVQLKDLRITEKKMIKKMKTIMILMKKLNIKWLK